MPNNQPITNYRLPIISHLSDELLFLITCCQIDPSKDDIEFMHSYLSGQHLDINTLIGLATQHGILPLVHKAIKKINAVYQLESQNDSLNELKAHYQNIVQRNMLMSAELILIMKLLEENDIEALAFKGPTLSQMASVINLRIKRTFWKKYIP